MKRKKTDSNRTKIVLASPSEQHNNDIKIEVESVSKRVRDRIPKMVGKKLTAMSKM